MPFRLFFAIVIGGFVAKAPAIEPPLTAIAFMHRGESLVATSQSGLHVFEWPKLEPTRTIKISAPNLHAVAFSQDDQYVAVGGGYPSEQGIVEVISWPAGEVVATLDDHEDSVRGLAWLDPTTLISVSIDRSIKLWKTVDEDARLTLQGHSRSVDAVCLLPDGKTLVTAGVDQSLRVWDLDSAKLVHSLKQHTGAVNGLALKPGRAALPMVASCSADRTIRFWQPTIGRLVRYIRLPSMALAVAWFNDGRYLAAACADGHVRIVDSEELTVIRDVAALTGWCYAIAVHPRDDTVVVAGTDGQIQRISIDLPSETLESGR